MTIRNLIDYTISYSTPVFERHHPVSCFSLSGIVSFSKEYHDDTYSYIICKDYSSITNELVLRICINGISIKKIQL